MSADNYILVRSFNDSFVVTDESASADAPKESTERAYERILNGNVMDFSVSPSKWYRRFGNSMEGVFQTAEEVDDFLGSIYEDNSTNPEYGVEYALYWEEV